ncbi:MAG: UDP-N-acetylglucosamine 2-epimerase (non-hydrolyzing) [Gemmatimonadetes bacterium]|nr:UDP-N-acetylglucosamine 2-epimerase (non-hydrolyzing) [Gemmatimonadota bacterium]
MPPSSGTRVLVVVGTRPEAIKMAPVLKALATRAPRLETRLVLTGQHTDLVDSALETFSLRPDWDLGIMREGQTLTEVARECLAGLEVVLQEWRPHLLLVQGDTASAFFATMAAYFQRIPIGHVEAGLRTWDLQAPFPEEGFRSLIGVLADLHFAPTATARENLLREGVAEERIHVTGNTVVDALLEVAGRGARPQSSILERLLAPEAPPFVLLTLHRRESFGAPIERVFGAVTRLVDEFPGVEVLYPVHPNPNVTNSADRILGGRDRIHLTPPLPYADLVAALAGARLILTDSGGIQEEAPTFGTPVLVLREKSERPEGLLTGDAHLVGTDPDRIVTEAKRILAGALQPGRDELGAQEALAQEAIARNPYGDGKAGERIGAIVEQFLSEAGRREDG